MLEQFGFTRREDPGKEYIHEEFRIADESVERQLIERLIAETEGPFQQLNYKLRQRKGEFA
jgi:PAS domain-containing protein